jgi:hypothetical protein
MRRKQAPLGHQILHVSPILRAVPRRGASAGAQLSRFPRVTPRKPPVQITTRGKAMGPESGNASSSRRLAIETTEATALAAPGTDPLDSRNLTKAPAVVTLTCSMRLARVHGSVAGPSRRGF